MKEYRNENVNHNGRSGNFESFESNDTINDYYKTERYDTMSNERIMSKECDTMRMPASDTHVKPVNCDETMTITSLSDLQSYSNGTIVRFPDFAEGQPFVARVKRPSMLMLAKMGKIPNSLLNSATQLFTKGGSGMDTKNGKTLSDIYDICEVIVKASLVQPTYDEIIDSGMTLSDDQVMAIFNYTQSGVKALENFRSEQEDFKRARVG